MKKIFFILPIALFLALVSCSGEKYSRDAAILPEKAQKLISQHFNSAISIVKEEKEFAEGKEYEVILADGCEITFDSKGEWKDIETPNNLAVPGSLVPKPIYDYIVANHHGASIVGIEKEKKGYEVELSNNLKIEFNKDGGFLKYDN